MNTVAMEKYTEQTKKADKKRGIAIIKAGCELSVTYNKAIEVHATAITKATREWTDECDKARNIWETTENQ